MRFWPIPLVCWTLLLGACSAIRQSPDASAHRTWSHRQGGIVRGAWQQHIDCACQRLSPAIPDLVIKPYVLDADDLSAYSWPDGEVFVTRGLIDAASPDELAAVIAHEAGHLIAHRRRSDATAMLRGRQSHLNPEIQADALGSVILADCNIPTTAMLHVLLKVQQATAPNDPSYALLCQRIKTIQQKQKMEF